MDEDRLRAKELAAELADEIKPAFEEIGCHVGSGIDKLREGPKMRAVSYSLEIHVFGSCEASYVQELLDGHLEHGLYKEHPVNFAVITSLELH